ncbi:MAG TPA: BT1926 family outer membrane beta-barrel protein [Bacteroidales bacterium]|nr:BT1926 family outer membrane beta-barrel protein [Bacteroidales bacterium]
MMKKHIITVLVALVSLPLFSQFNAGTLKVSLNLGNSPYVGMLQAPSQTSSTQYLSVEPARWVSGTSNSLVNMVGMEVKFFVADNLACKFIGGGQISVTPGQNEIPGVDNDVYPFDPQTAIPAFSDVKEQKQNQFLFQVGADKYFSKNNVAIYAGGELGFRYGAGKSKSITETSAGSSIAEVYGYFGAIDFGAEYNTNDGLFVGVEIRPVSVAYSVSTIEPIPGVSQKGDNLNVGFFVYPTVRFGINF